jgi:acyl-CoA-binding protein
MEKEFNDVLSKLNDIDLEIMGLSDTIKLEFYKYYKQAKTGDCNIDKPWFVNVTACAKWEAWNSIKGMKKEEAMEKYIECYKNYILNP